jgi:DNA-binding response OmpR family regulator
MCFRKEGSVAGGLGHILVVEDEYLLAIDLVDALKRQGASVVGPVFGLAEALKAISDASVLDGAIVDLNLRGEMSFPVAELLQAKKVPFLLTSGYDRSAVSARFVDVPLIEKPFDAVVVVETLKSLMAPG